MTIHNPVPTDNLIDTTTSDLSFNVNGNTGSDSNPGTEALPFATIQKALNSVPATYSNDVAINIASGTYTEALDATYLGSLDASKKIKLIGTKTELTSELTVTSVGTDSVTVSGAGWTPNDFEDKFFYVTGGDGYYGDDVFLNIATIDENDADTLYFINDVPPGVDVGTEFYIIEPATIVDANNLELYALVCNSNSNVTIECRFMQITQGQSGNVGAIGGECVLLGCDISATNEATGLYVSQFGHANCRGLLASGGFTIASVYASNGSAAILFSTIRDVTGSGARGVRAGDSGIVSVKNTLIFNCNEGMRAGTGGIIDAQDCDISECVTAMRSDGNGYIEAFDSTGELNDLVAKAFTGGNIWYNSSLMTGTVDRSVDTGAQVVDNDTGYTYVMPHLKDKAFTFDYATVIGQGKPTLVTRGVHKGFSLPVYNSDNEELFSCDCVPMDWDGNSVNFKVGGWLASANTDKNFNMQISIDCTSDGDVVSTSSTDVEVETGTETASQYQFFTIDFPFDASSCEIGDAFSFRIRRIAASSDEITGEFIVKGVGFIYTADKLVN